MKKTALPQPTKRRLPPLESLVAAPFQPVLGQAVEITAGQLAGIRGVVVEIADAAHCVVKLDTAAPGVLVAIGSQWLRKAARTRT